MNKRPRLSKSGIEYLDYQWGIFSGCRNHNNGICPVRNCWAKGIALHYPKLYPNGFNPTFYPEALESPLHLNREPKRIGVGWVGDIIGYGLEYKDKIYDTIRQTPWHTYLFLTKNPERLVDWSPFPRNCEVGVSACNKNMVLTACRSLTGIEATTKFLSLEPILDELWLLPSTLVVSGINLVILGSQTRPTVYPKIEWVEEMIGTADKAKARVFIKNNLEPIIPEQDGIFREAPHILRQEIPHAK